jgi:8-oxo-dGTP pyrophosphatase MutT (NUDIX family)
MATPAAPAEPRDASTVVVLRDKADPAASGFEVLLVKRSREVDFMAGAHVFPGGRLDKDDSSPTVRALLSASKAVLHKNLGEDIDARHAAGLYVAAIRETFEEAGLLYGQLAPGWALPAARRAVNEGALFPTMVSSVDVAALVPWVRWVTPPISPRRFDARFFLARLPEGQDAVVDGREATEHLWISPREALERWGRGDLLLPPATAKSIDALTPFATAAEAMAAAAGRVPPVVTPKVWNEGGRAYISLPGDPRHPMGDVLGGELKRIQLQAGRYMAVPAH